VPIINLKGIIIISSIIVHINFAQTANDKTPIKIDTAKQKSTDEKTEKQSLRLYELKVLYNNLFNTTPFYNPGKNIISKTPDALSYYGYGVGNYRTADRLKKFNESLYELLAKKYGEMGRYDLGEFGRYLGIAKNIITIALWILSF